MALSQGVSCTALPGWAPILAPAQCEQAAKAFKKSTRAEPYSMQFEGKTWYLVRRASYESGHWHQARDDLKGFDNYGQYDWNPLSTRSFSTSFGQRYSKVLVATGDISNWMVLDKESGCLRGNSSTLISSSECMANFTKRVPQLVTTNSTSSNNFLQQQSTSRRLMQDTSYFQQIAYNGPGNILPSSSQDICETITNWQSEFCTSHHSRVPVMVN